MPLNIKISTLNTHIHVDYFGEYDFKPADDVIDEIVELCKSKKYTKVIFDFRKIKGEISTFDRYRFATHLASTNPANISFVGIATKHQTLPVKIGEIFSAYLGVNLIITEDASDAFRLLDIKKEK